MTAPGQKTPLYAQHLALGARMTDFAGFSMPLQYKGIKSEHLAVREKSGLFDVSHMGEIEIKGDQAAEFVNFLMTRSFDVFSTDKAVYTLMCDDDGKTVDDLLVYPLTVHRFLLVVNCANLEKDLQHIRAATVRFGQTGQATPQIQNSSDQYALLALQGPESQAMIQKLLPDAARLENYHFTFLDDRPDWLISRTGYTGEDGFEIYLPPHDAPKLWDRLIESGALPAGLGARDSLRLEAGLPLYGHELTDEISPLEAGLARFVDLDKPAPGFIGQQALLSQRPERRLIGLVSTGHAIPRANYPVVLNEQTIGRVTSGMYSPTLARGICLALVDQAFAAESFYEIEIRGKLEPFAKNRLPFVSRHHQ